MYPLIAVAAGLLISWGSTGGFIADPEFREDEDDALSQMVEMPAGRAYEFPTQTDRLVRVGVSYTPEGNPVVFGAHVVTFKNAPLEKHPAFIVTKRMYFCGRPELIQTLNTAVFTKNNELITEKDGLVIPQPVNVGSFEETEIKFMCEGVERKPCTKTRGCV